MDTEDIPETTDDRLMSFLYKVNELSSFQSVKEIFNAPFDLQVLLDGFSTQTSDLNDIYTELTRDHRVDNLVHFLDVCKAGSLGRSGFAKKWSTLHPDWQKIIKPCKFHGNVYCQLVENDIGLLIFYSLLPTPKSTVIPKQISQRLRRSKR